MHPPNKVDQIKKMSDFNKHKDEADKLIQNVKEEAESVADLMNQGESLGERVMASLREMVRSLEENWFQGDREKMVGSMVGIMMLILGIFLYLVFYEGSKDE